MSGGGYRFEFGHEGSKPTAFFGRYIEVTPHSRLVWTNEESDDGAVTTVTFEEKGGKTLLVMHELYPSKEALDRCHRRDGGWDARDVRATGRASRHLKRGRGTVMKSSISRSAAWLFTTRKRIPTRLSPPAVSGPAGQDSLHDPAQGAPAVLCSAIRSTNSRELQASSSTARARPSACIGVRSASRCAQAARTPTRRRGGGVREPCADLLLSLRLRPPDGIASWTRSECSHGARAMFRNSTTSDRLAYRAI